MTKRLSETAKQRLKKQLAGIEELKKQLAESRDKLQEEFNDLESLLESLNLADEQFESGLDAIRRGIDAASEYI